MISQKKFLELEIEEMKKYKWILSEKFGYDVGENCCLEWVEKYSEDFRNKIEKEFGKINS